MSCIRLARDLASLANGATVFAGSAEAKLVRLREVLAPLAARYDVVVANPPYMGGSNMNRWVSGWVKRAYPTAKRDICTCFIKRGGAFVEERGYIGMITASSWMFISSFEQFRRDLLASGSICSMIQQSTHGYAGVTVPTTMFVFAESQPGIVGSYIRLEDFDRPQWQEEKALEALADPGCGWCFKRDAKTFESIPSIPLAYWIGNGIWRAYGTNPTLETTARPKVGMQTSNNEKYLRLWWEIHYSDFKGDSHKLIWIKYLKGGDYRKWYGNLEYLLHYNKDAEYILQQPHARVLDTSFLEKCKCTWTDLTSGRASFRYAPRDTFYDISGHCFFPDEDNQYFLLGYVNTSLVNELKRVFNSSFHFQVGDLTKIVSPPAEIDTRRQVTKLAKQSVESSKYDWDARETSWDFARHPLV